MAELVERKELFPERFRVLSGSMLKLIALVSMLVDHTAVVLLSNYDKILFTIGSRSMTVYRFMRYVGRFAFPIYGFLIVEGFIHTKDRRKYGIRLFLFALLSEPAWNIEHTGNFFYPVQNVFFTLFLGYMGIWAFEAFRHKPWRQAAVLVVLLTVSFRLNADHGYNGFGYILMVYALRQTPVLQAIVGATVLDSTWKAALAFIPINLYNGKRGFIKGRFLQILFYVIYPGHMLILYLLKRHFIGY